jgi:hypothetical protein
MPRLRVVINKVVCHTTEDNLGADEIYLIAASAQNINDLSDPKKATIARLPALTSIPNPSGGQPTLKAPTKEMNNGSEWEPNKEIINVQVGYGPLAVGVWLMDQDASEDIEEDDIKRMQDAVSAAGLALAPTTNGASAAAGGIANVLIGFIGKLMMLDSDDLLGFTDPHYTTNLIPPSPTMPTGWPGQYGSFGQYFPAQMDGANYDVFYTVIVEP